MEERTQQSERQRTVLEIVALLERKGLYDLAEEIRRMALKSPDDWRSY